MKLIEIGTIVRRKNGRKWIKISNSKWIPYAIYVAQQNPELCGEWFDGCEVHHKDGNRENDDPQNLICLSKEEHRNIHKEINEKTGIGVKAYKNGELVGDYPTIVSCGEAIGFPPPYIYLYLKNNCLPKGKYSDMGYTFEQTTINRIRKYK